MKRIGSRAVVIGASMGGLLAARALADDFETVTLLERDVFVIADRAFRQNRLWQQPYVPFGTLRTGRP